MLKPLKVFTFLLLCLPAILTACDSGSDSSLAGTQQAEESFSSSITGITYPIRVYLPPSYDATDTLYPIIYTTDAEWRFGELSQYIAQSHIQAIVIGIGNSNGQVPGRRDIDYLLPGSLDYYQFLTTELVPYIESNYRISEQNRTLFGHSYGGLLVACVLFMEDPAAPFFHNYIAADASFWQNSSATLELVEQRYNISSQLPARLFLTGATNGGNDESVNAFKEMLSDKSFENLEIIKYTYNLDHIASSLPSFSDAVDHIFAQDEELTD